MIWHPVLVTAPAAEPVSTEEVKDHLRVSFDDDDDYIDGLIIAARQQLEDETKRRLVSQTWDLYGDQYPCGPSIPLPFGKLQSITSLKHTDSDGTETTVATTVYEAVTWEDPGRLTLKYGQMWPTSTLKSAGGVVVRFVCGYGDPKDVPRALKQSMLMRIGHWYENREEVALGQGIVALEVPNAAKALAWPYRINIV